MTIETLKSPNPRNRNSISVIKSKFLSVSSMNTLLAIWKVIDARRDVILAGGPQITLETPPPPRQLWKKTTKKYIQKHVGELVEKNFEPDQLLRYLFQENIINVEDMEKVRSKNYTYRKECRITIIAAQKWPRYFLNARRGTVEK